uniref:Uncharacterized protein n=1 Tax=Octopus bimaculoides TaxID=37653 RepID=A0A0L8HM06_OCTBM
MPIVLCDHHPSKKKLINPQYPPHFTISENDEDKAIYLTLFPFFLMVFFLLFFFCSISIYLTNSVVFVSFFFCLFVLFFSNFIKNDLPFPPTTKSASTTLR